jgi:hypothetical protein
MCAYDKALAIASSQCVGLPFSFTSSSHKLQFKGPISFCLAIVIVPLPHVELLTAHGTLPLGGVDVKRLM